MLYVEHHGDLDAAFKQKLSHLELEILNFLKIKLVPVQYDAHEIHSFLDWAIYCEFENSHILEAFYSACEENASGGNCAGVCKCAKISLIKKYLCKKTDKFESAEIAMLFSDVKGDDLCR